MNTIKQSKIEFGNRVMRRRKEIDMTQDELAKLMGYKHRSAVQKIESGENSIPQDKIQKLANCLKTSVEYLMGWSDVTDRVLSEYLVELSEEYLDSTLPTEDEIRLIACYRNATSRDKSLVDRILNYENTDTKKA